LAKDENIESEDQTPEAAADDATPGDAVADEAPTAAEPAAEEASVVEATAEATAEAEPPAAEDAPAEEPAADAEAPAKAEPKTRKRTVKAKAGEPQEDEGPSARAPRGAKAKKAEPAPKRAKTKAERGTYVRTPATEGPQGQRRERRGVVTSDKGDKTITVRVDVMKAHPKYHKIMRRSVTLHAHDEANEAHVGDVVRVVECRPLSRSKRWRLVEIVEVAR
jgi:small subunit ribosomal protein S17